MHKSGTRPEKLRKLSKRHHRYSLELSIPDDKGAARSEQRQYCEDIRMSMPPILRNGLERVHYDHDTPISVCAGCVEDMVALEFDGVHI